MKGYVYVGVSVAIVIIGIFLICLLESTKQTTGVNEIVTPIADKQVTSSFCLPKDLSQIKLGFPFKLPTVLPAGYSLQGIEYDWSYTGITYFLYGTHPVCRQPPHFSSYPQALEVSVMKERNTEGHAVYAPNGTFTGYNVTQLPPMTSLEFQQGMIKTEHKLGLIKFSKEVDVNSYKGLISFDNASVGFLNDKDQVLYGVTGGIGGDVSINQLLIVARSIPP